MRAVQVAAPRGTAPFFAWRQRKEANLRFNWQYHVEYELTYIVRGRGIRFVGDNTSSYGAGDLVLLAPNLPHSWAGDDRSKQKQECMVLHFGSSLIPAYETGSADSLVPLSKLLADARRGLSFHGRCKDAAVKILLNLGKRRPLEGLARFYDLIDELCQSKATERKCLSTRSYDPDVLVHGQAQDELSRVVAFVKSHHRRSISVSEVAALISRSPTAFSRFFRRSTGESFVSYLNEFRIAQSSSLLLHPDHSVAAVARTVGFQSVAHFNRLFLKLRGETPTSFRQRTGKFLRATTTTV
jgi:AraC-like DNA-binding protein